MFSADAELPGCELAEAVSLLAVAKSANSVQAEPFHCSVLAKLLGGLYPAKTKPSVAIPEDAPA